MSLPTASSTNYSKIQEVYSEAEIDSDGRVIYMPPPLDDIWLDEAERRAKRIEQSKSRATDRDRWIQDESSPLYDTTPPTPPERPDKNVNNPSVTNNNIYFTMRKR